MDDRGKLTLITCDSGRVLAERVCREIAHIDADREPRERFCITDSVEIVFPNREIKTIINKSIRGDDVYVLQCVDDPLSARSINDNLMAVLTAINAAYEADAESVTAVLPQFPYSRQDRKKTREGHTARQVASFIEESGANRVLTIDIHSEAIGSFFRRAVLDNLHASRVIIDYFSKEFPTDNLAVVSPDVGSADRARFFANSLNTRFAIVDKERQYDTDKGGVTSQNMVGSQLVADKDVLIVDDMISTGGSIIAASEISKKNGARDVYLACSHAFLHQDAGKKLDSLHSEGLFKALIGTDTVIHGEAFMSEHPWYREVSVAPLIAKVIVNINEKRSVSALLK